MVLVGNPGRAGKYLYGVIRSPVPVRFGTIALDGIGADVVTVNHGDLAVVVSDISSSFVGPSRANLLAHQEVNELVMRRHTLIPASFGTIVASTDALVELLRRQARLFARVLGDLDSKVQYGVKAVWDRDAIVRSIENDDPGLRRIAVSSGIGSVAKREAARRRYARTLRSRVESRIAHHTRELLEVVRSVVVASRVNQPIGDAVLLNAAFLVSRDLETEFVRRVCEFGGRDDEVTVKYGGPWPAYDFVTIPLTLEQHG